MQARLVRRASLPNSSASSSGSLIAAQLMRTNEAGRRGDISWMRSANRSLPTPVSPRIEHAELADRDARGRLLERGELARLRRRSRGASRRASAPSRVTRADQERDADAERGRAVFGGEPRAVDERAVRAADVLDLDVGADEEIRVVARDRARVDRRRRTCCERPIVSVPVPGSGTTWSEAPSMTSSTRSPNGACAIDLFGRGAGLVVDHGG